MVGSRSNKITSLSTSRTLQSIIPLTISCISRVHTTHTFALAMDFLTSIFLPVAPATGDHEDPIDRDGGSSNPYGFCVVA